MSTQAKRPPKRQPTTKAKQRRFLDWYAKLGTVLFAACKARCQRTEHYRWLNEPDYAQRFEHAREDAKELLIAEARSRAHEGVPVTYKGKRLRGVRQYSDPLLMFLIKQADPSYRENARMEHTGAAGAPIEIRVKFVKADG
ncbi:MAG TPA: hypothetical protein VMW52_07855 [Phycisphaerae bacterium]|nr:hypothetical protein [Phycisphaerae bacterium]